MTPQNSSPWVYIFSRFTSEALLFEALIIFALCALYTGFWLLRKRKFGVVKKEVPAGVVKYYLNELIFDAEQVRAQLFGLLAGQGITPTPIAGLVLGSQPGATAAALNAAAPGSSVSIVAGDPQSAQTLAALEAKLAEQAKQIENFVAEKKRVEQELAAAKAGGGGAASPSGDDSKLKEKIAQLEAKLAEYSVIEDDLANLKRLQQENSSLKTQLGKGAAPNDTIAAAPKAKEAAPNVTMAKETLQETSVAAAPVTAPEPQPETTTTATAGAEGGAAAEQTTEAASGALAADEGATSLGAPVEEAPTGSLAGSEFEGLVDQVEQSLQKPAAEEATAANLGKGKVSSTDAAPAATIEKSDADLVAEFEKMLNG